MAMIRASSIDVRCKALNLHSLLTDIAVSDPVETEADFLRLWQSHCSDLTPFEMAVVGGALADRFSWIFTAGYQGAIRHIFPNEVFAGWAAFAVSEDRSETDPLPGVTYVEQGDGVLLNGSKTWVAASAHCNDVVFSAGRGGDKRFFRVSRGQENLEIETRPPGRMLPDLSQGSAHFKGVLLPFAHEVDTSLVPGFGPCEVLYIYSAFLASTYIRLKEADEGDVAVALLNNAEAISRREEISRDHADMIELDAGVQKLLAHLRENVFGDVDLWRRDYKLVAMYSRS